MNQMNAHVISLFEVLGQSFGTIDRTVLTAGATKGHLKVSKTAFDEPLCMMIHKFIHGFQESQDLAVFLQEINNGLIQARELFVLLVLAGVVRATTVKDIPATVTGFVCRKAAFKREGVNGDGEIVFRDLVIP